MDCISQKEIEYLIGSKEKVLVIDVRDASDYEEQHIPQAIHIPLSHILEVVNKVDSETWVFTVCGKGGGRSAKASDVLQTHGIAKTKWICGGTLGWK